MFSLFELLTQNAMAIGNALAGNRRTLVIFSFNRVISGDYILGLGFRNENCHRLDCEHDICLVKLLTNLL